MFRLDKSTTENSFIPMTSISNGLGIEVVPDIYSYTIQIVNVAFIGHSENPYDWILVDTGMPNSAEEIIKASESRFGLSARPKAIILTHGHFDHIGSITDLVKHWGVKVYAHKDELPYLTGKQNYPDPDWTVEGGAIAKISKFFPNECVNIECVELNSTGIIEELPGWRWIHTPGHTPGHISLFRDSDRSLIAGDAFITVRQDSLFKVLTQDFEINGPPRYYTTDWQASWESVKKLAALQPRLALTGHGLPATTDDLSKELYNLADNFEIIAIPKHGKYVH
ncbi:MAG: metallo-beta-lactamase family protein [Bacillales bacterium]|nr:metallo-beta-lactamase family protein [Bacillales bacterium]